MQLQYNSCDLLAKGTLSLGGNHTKDPLRRSTTEEAGNTSARAKRASWVGDNAFITSEQDECEW
jgi:hypothetical protein